VTTRWFRRHAPGALPAWDSRPARTLEAERFLADLPGVLQIRPPLGSPSVSRIATDPALLGSAVAIGHAAAAVVLKQTGSTDRRGERSAPRENAELPGCSQHR
jgi:hypothetical protein